MKKAGFFFFLERNWQNIWELFMIISATLEVTLMSATWLKRNFSTQTEAPKISKVGSEHAFIMLWYYHWTGRYSIHAPIIEHSFAAHIKLKPNALLERPLNHFPKHLSTSELVQMQEAKSTECPARKISLHFCSWKPLDLKQRNLLREIVEDLPPKYWTK